MSDPRYTRSRVRPYYRADGTYVGGYLRSKPTTRAKAKKDDGSDIFGLVIALVILAAVIGPHLPAA